MTHDDQRPLAMGIFTCFFGLLCAAGGSLLTFRFPFLRGMFNEMGLLARNLLATPGAVFEAQGAILGLLLLVAGGMLLLVGLALLQYARRRRTMPVAIGPERDALRET